MKNLENIKNDLEIYQNEKDVILEEIKEKECEYKELCKIHEEIQKKLEQKYKKISSKQKNPEKLKNSKIESPKTDFLPDDSKMYFSSNNSNSDFSSILEPIPTGKFREKTTNSKESMKNMNHFKNNQEDESVEFSSIEDDEVDFDLSSEGSGRNK